MTVEETNALALRRLHLIHDYINLMAEIEAGLDQYRLLLSKARSIIGVSTASALSIDNRELKPTRWVTNNEGLFEIFYKDDISERRFQPFGILEPLPVKQARKTVGILLPRFAELATLQKEIRAIEGQFAK